MTFGEVIPVLRMFDEAATRAFYCGYLGFAWAWEHRHEPELPLYAGITRGGCQIHLSEHHGDATPGSSIRISCPRLDDLQAELSARNYGFARPGIEEQPWGKRELTVTDPSGNRLTFFADP
jgi:uncharacterized glyoxalase superfamily protein PhnB